jgi:hypothetical protein
MASNNYSIEPRPVCDIVQRPITWLWENRLAYGKLAILDGDPGLGKSLVALDLCARLSTSRPFPDGSLCPGPANSIVINGEDADEDTIAPRLAALGADMNRVFVLQRTDGRFGLPLSLPTQLDGLDHVIAKTRAKLVVLDPIVAFLDPSIHLASDASVRQALLPLAELADLHDAVPFMVRHLNKSNSHRSTYRGGGSIGFLGVCRSGWLVAPHPRLPKSQRVLAQVKNNLAGPQPSLVYEVLKAEGRPTTLNWLDACDWTADQLLVAVARAPALARRQLAIDFLNAFLKDGPRTVPDIWVASTDQRLSKATLQRAKKALSICSQKVFIDNLQRNYWMLPGQKLPPNAVADVADQFSLEPWLAPLREQFPPPTPIDDL